METITRLTREGTIFFLSGGAVGFDTFAAQAVLKAQKRSPKLKLIMALPCRNQEKYWSEADKQAYRHLLDKADEIVYVSEHPYFDGCME